MARDTVNDVKPPDGFRLIYQGAVLPPFYAAEMLRPLIGRFVWVRDSGGRTRSGELAEVPAVREDAVDCIKPVTFTDERPLFLRGIDYIAVYEPPR